MQNLSILVASQLHQKTILEILVETQVWLWAQGIEQWTLPFEADWIEQSIENEEFFVAIYQSEIVAVFRLTLTDGLWADRPHDAFYIHNLAVTQAWRGRGIGFILVDWIKDYAIKNERGYLRLDCMAENQRLCRFYEQVGFKKLGIKEIQNEASVYKAQLFEKELGPKHN